MSTQDLARISGVSPTTINMAERGEREPHPSTIRKLAKALNVEPIEIIGSPEG